MVRKPEQTEFELATPSSGDVKEAHEVGKRRVEAEAGTMVITAL